MQYAIAHLDQDGKADCDQNPYISVDFENNLESCLEAANMMEDEGYQRYKNTCRLEQSLIG